MIFASFSDVLRTRARETSDRVAYVFLQDGEEESGRLTFGQLDERARSIAAALQERGLAGERALLLYPPGLEFIAAFFGCLYAGVVAVPSYPPSPSRPGRGQPRLRAILEDAAPRIVLTVESLLPRLAGLEAELPALAGIERLATESLNGGSWSPPALTPESLAFLQYTSGSTSEPKGVMVSHGNLLHNEEVIRSACGHDERSTFVSWLPMYHDMGLIGGVLQPLYAGASCVLMAPVAFLQRPARWLRAISRWRGHTSGAPDFAYDLCVSRISEEQRAELDLSSWRVAFDGSEPVKARTLAAFSEAFGPSGFRPEAFFPCYGLAEATLIVSGRSGDGPPVVREEGERKVVGCGPAGTGLEIAIADPEGLTALDDGATGEVWVSGGSVAQGYWNRPELTERTFQARLAGRPEPFLRTGDLGFLRDGRLFVTGRIKDLIIVRGRNHYPQDLETTVSDNHTALRSGAGAAFAVETDGGEAVVVVHEMDIRRRPDPDEVLGAARQALAEEHEVPVRSVVLLKPGGVPKTTSGKVQRQLCRRLFLESSLDAVARWDAGPAVALEAMSEEPEDLPGWLRRRAAARLGVEENEIDPRQPLTRYGLDSLAAVELAHEIESVLGIGEAMPMLLESASLEEVARALTPGPSPGRTPGPPGEGSSLTPGERALWFLQQLDPAGSSYTIAGAARVLGDIQESDLRRRFQAMVDRHPALRSTFTAVDGEPVRRIAPVAEVDFQAEDVGDLARRIDEEVFRPFDLETGPLLRVRLLRSVGETVLTLAIHHLIADFWSLALMLRGQAEAETFSATASPEPDWAFWEERLADFPTVLELPADRPRPSHVAASLPFEMPEAEALAALGRERGATPFVALLAAFQLLLHRITGQDRLLVGAPTAGRSRAADADRVGYFVNPVVLASEASGESFLEHLDTARRTVLDAFAHEVPFPLLVEHLQPERDPERTPLFQAAFSFYRAPRQEQEGLAAFALNLPGVRVDLDGLALESLSLPRQPGQFDLTLLVAEVGGRSRLSFLYDTGLFDASTVQRLAGHLRNLVAGLADAPDRPAAEVSLWSEAERWQAIGEWNDTEAPVSAVPVHERIATQPPSAVAVGDWTYRELTRRAWALAWKLRGLGIGPDEVVAVLAERRRETIAAHLAVLAAGGAYLPIDPSSPPERSAWLVRDSGARVLLAQQPLGIDIETVLIDELAEERDSPPPVQVDPLNLAYVIHTSGSTGVPKGVAVSHGALAALVDWHLRAMDVTAADVASHVAGLGFDASVWEVWPYLAAGASLRLPDEETRVSPERLRDWMAAEGITIGFVPTPLLEPMLGLDWTSGPRLLLTGGDRLRTRPAAGLPFRLRNNYGPTESAVVATSGEVGPGNGLPDLGRPIAGTRVHLLDRSLAPVPIGSAGEMFLAGVSLARGYLGQPGATAERFLPDPFGPPGSRMYRTGDLARRRPDGRLEFLGRTDHQIKLRGVRIEPGEVERQMLAAGVREAVVMAVGPRLAAFVVGVPDQDLRGSLAARLPQALVPSVFVTLESLPLTRNGKVDRAALASLVREADDREMSLPRNAAEEVIAGIWAEVLDLPRVGVDEDFFSLGGHSLLATRVVSRMRSALGVDLPVRSLFEAPTVAALAERVGSARELEPPIVAAPRDRDLPLSFAQQRLWFLHQLDPQSPAYHVPGILRLEGRLDVSALEGALRAIARRHESLRTTVSLAGEQPAQRISLEEEVQLPVVDLSKLSCEARRAEAERLGREEARRPFDLERGPVWRARLLRLAEEEHELVVVLHHIVADGWSLGVLLRELGALYPSLPMLAPLPVQIADVAVWQRAWLQGQILEKLLGWWTERLAGAEPLRLPTDRPRTALPPARGRTHPFRVREVSALAAEGLARSLGATPFMVLLAAWNALLGRCSGQSDLSVGSPIANRNRIETEGLIGCLVNTVVLRTRLEDESFSSLVSKVRETTLGAYDHQDLPFELLVEALRPERDLGLSPLFQSMFVLQNMPMPRLELPGLRLGLAPLETGAPKLDLVLSLERDAEGLAGTLEYPLELFDPETVERLAARFRRLLDEALADPGRRVDELPLLSAAERAQLLAPGLPESFQRSSEPVLLHRRVALWAERTPDAPAVSSEDGTLTYAELDRRANGLAHRLVAIGVDPGARVGVWLERSVEAVTAILGTLKAGAAWVPLDPSHPLERLARQAEDAGLAALVTTEALGALTGALPVVLLDGREEETAPDLDLPGNAAAYVLFTSGSTGRPKGVVCQHDGLLNLIEAFDGLAPISPGDAGSLQCSLSFDVSVWEIFSTLTAGGRLEIVPQPVRADGRGLARWIAERGIANAYVPPALVADLAAFAQESDLPLKRLIVGVEPLPEPLLAGLAARCPGLRILNGYGPTETTVCATVYPIPAPIPTETAPPERNAPIGRAVGDTRVYLLSPALELVPPGSPGEIGVGGAGVAHGYLGRPDLTAERFRPDPYAGVPGARLYRTGDLARRLAGGDLAFLGRFDHQVKIRGVRIEPGEVEAALREHPGVREAVVAARRDPRGELRLVAWVAGEAEVDARGHLRARLPDAMVPSVLVRLEALPQTPHGKVDRAALPEPDWQRPELSGERVPPRTAVETLLAGIWMELLGLEEIGVHDSFFDLGGHSLKAGQLVVRLRDELGIELPVRSVFEAPTIAAQAVAIGRRLVEEADPELLAQIRSEL
ncbi:MAG: amino acid adenylation domain-containing protein [Acidobacteriota bacterium]